MGEGLTLPSFIRAWDSPMAEGAELLEGSWKVKRERGKGQGSGAALRNPQVGVGKAEEWKGEQMGGQASRIGETGQGRMLTTALLRTKLAGVVPALARPLAATAPALGGVESFGHRAPSALKMGEAETLPCVCGVIPQRIAGKAISSTHLSCRPLPPQPLQVGGPASTSVQLEHSRPLTMVIGSDIDM